MVADSKSWLGVDGESTHMIRPPEMMPHVTY